MRATAELELTPLEVASGLLLGSDRKAVIFPRPERTCSPRTALEDAIRPALLRPPCLISFSGGRDSSALLAVGAQVARREGLAAPIPYTLRFPAAPDTDEAHWQERVISHLRIEDWVRRDMDDELDCIGPYASRMLERHGLLWPFNAHFAAPAAEAAARGSVITGAGGDQIFAFSRLERHRDLLARQARPRPRDALRLAYAMGPLPVRRAVLRRRPTELLELPWLRPAAQQAIAAAVVSSDASEPVRPREHLRWILGLRALRVGLASFALVASDYGARMFTPLLDPTFAATLAREPGRSFYMDRTRAMRALVGDLLPADVCERTSKAVFQDPFWNRHTRAFAERWDGHGVDGSLVDVDALRAYWRSPEPVAQSMTLLQSAWLAERRRSEGSELGQGVEEEPARLRE